MMWLPDKLRKLKNVLRYIHNDLPQQLIRLSDMAERLDSQLKEQDSQLKEQTARLSGLTARIDKIEGALSVMDYYNPELNTLLGTRKGLQVLVVGFYGGYNFGDEMMLQVILEILARRKDIHVTVMLSENAVYYNSSIHGNIDIIHYCRTYGDFSHLSSYFDALIVGGGALLDDKTYRQDYRHFLNLSAIVCELPAYFKAKNKPAVCLGLSTNERLTDPAYISALSRTIDGSYYFSLRDPYSYDVLRSAGIHVDKVEIIEDMLLAHPFWMDLPADICSRNEGTSVAITWYSEDSLKDMLAEIIKLLVQQDPSVRISLIPVYDFLSADTTYYRQVAGLLPDEAAKCVHIEPYQTTMEQIVNCFSRCSMAINVRYHAAMVCGCLGIPQIAVVWKDHPHYPNKMRWISDAFPGVYLMGTENTAEDIAKTAGKHLGDPRGALIDPARVKRNAEKISGIIERFIPPETAGEADI